MSNSSPRAIVIGGATIDIKGRVQKPLVPLTSNPGRIRISVGGVARNVAENLARLGVSTTLLSAVGDDEQGARILEETTHGGVDTSQVIVSAEHRSGAYLAILDGDGLLTAGVSDMGIMDLITPHYIYAHRRLINQAQVMVLDAGLGPRAIRSALSAAKRAGIPVCADPTSVSLAPRFKRHLAELTLITPNVTEAEVFCERKITDREDALAAAHHLVSLGVETAIVTLGAEGVCYASSDQRGYIPAIKCDVADFTGAGDAMTAAVVFGLLNDMPLDEAVRLGVSAATLTLKCVDTVCPDLSLERLYQQLVI